MLAEPPSKTDSSTTQKTFSFICGNDDYLVDRKGKELFNKLTSALTDDFSKEIIDATAQNVAAVESIINQFLQSAQTLSLFGENKVVWLRGVNFLADSVTGRAEGTKAQLETLLDVLNRLDYSTVEILITASPVDKRTRAYKQLNTAGDSQLIGDDAQSNSLQNIISQECKELGVQIAPDAQEILISNINGNTRLLIQEIRKLATYLGEDNATITASLVLELVPQFGEGDFFEFSEAFFSLDLQWTLDAIKRHFFTQNESRPLISSLQNRLRLLIQLRVLIDSGSLSRVDKNSLQSISQTYNLDPKIKSGFNITSQNPWYLNKLANTARKIPLRKLINFQQAILEAFEGILQHPQNQETVIRNLAFKCLT